MFHKLTSAAAVHISVGAAALSGSHQVAAEAGAGLEDCVPHPVVSLCWLVVGVGLMLNGVMG